MIGALLLRKLGEAIAIARRGIIEEQPLDRIHPGLQCFDLLPCFT